MRRPPLKGGAEPRFTNSASRYLISRCCAALPARLRSASPALLLPLFFSLPNPFLSFPCRGAINEGAPEPSPFSLSFPFPLLFALLSRLSPARPFILPARRAALRSKAGNTPTKNMPCNKNAVHKPACTAFYHLTLFRF